MLPAAAFLRCHKALPLNASVTLFSKSSTKHTATAARLAFCKAKLRPLEKRVKATSIRESSYEATSIRGNSYENQAPPEPFDWHKQWYPVALVDELDPGRPHSITLLGMKLVVWRDEQKQWCCFEDICPHRLVPLSEGRIDETDGTLMCGYHGWRFGGDGKPTYIPQIHATDTDREQNALKNPKGRANKHPTQVQQDLLFIWASSSADAQEESAQVKPPLNGFMQTIDGFQYSYHPFQRTLRGGMEIWVENSMDQSHTSFAHHSKGPHSRGGPLEGSFTLNHSNYSRESFGFDYTFSLTGKSLVDAATVFKPPCLLELSIKQNPDRGLWIYCVPVTKECTKVFIASGGKPMPVGWREQLLLKIPLYSDLKRARAHLHLHNVTDGDAVFMHQQSQNINENGDVKRRWSNAYMLPGDNDRGVSLWMKWLVNEAGGGPHYPSHSCDRGVRDGLGKIKRRELLDRFKQHTEDCSSCRRVLEAARKLEIGATAVVGLSFLAAASVLGQGFQLLSAPLGICGASFALALLAVVKLRAYQELFHYQEYHQADLPPVK